jgi:hypothetical protein
VSFNDYWQAQQRRRAVAAAIAKLKDGGPAAQAQLYETLRLAVLLLPVAELPEGHATGDVVVGQNVQIKVALAKGPDEKLYLPCFTSEENLHRGHSDEEVLYVLLPFQAIAQMALTANAVGVLLDRAGPHSAIMPRPMLESLAAGQAQFQPSPSQAQPGQPQRPTLHLSAPPRLVTHAEIMRLHEWLAQQPNLAQAYLFGLLYGTGKPVLTIGMGFLQPPGRDTMEQLAKEAGHLLGPVGVIGLDGKMAAALARQAGAIRFDFTVEGRESTDGAPPTAAPPSPDAPHSPA